MIMQIRKSMRSQRGFTLVELMVVVAILGILAAIAIPKLGASTDSAKIAKIQADLRTIGGAIAMYYADNSSNPADLAALVPQSGKQYLAAVPVPEAGKSYSYSKDTGEATYTFNGKVYSSFGTVADEKKL